MTKIPLTFIKTLLFFLLSSLPLLVISQSLPSDQSILLNIKKQWGNQPPLESWDPTISTCRWPGIQCLDGKTVTGINLNSVNVAGEIPPSICDLENLTVLDLGNNGISGEFPKSLYNCSKLQSLNLSLNLLVGKLPNDINNLSLQLENLDLSYNNFSGDIPSSIGQLKGLINLNLTYNLFDGTFPSEFGNLENLESLFLSYNPFKPMNLPSEIGNLKKLTFLWMKQCNLNGEIPRSFVGLSNLEHLDLVDNKLVGEIPNGLFLIKNLAYLYLYHNKLSGGLPNSIVNASNLKEIDVSNNNMTGTIPEEIGELTKLEILNLFNNQFEGTLPPSLGLIPTLRIIKIWSNRFSGPLPAELGLNSKLENFEVETNDFTGQLPPNLCSGKTLFGVVAYSNHLNGTIPSSLAECHSLVELSLDKNSFSGEVPHGLWTLPNMSIISLHDNQFSGDLPEKVAANFTHILIDNNKFTGKISTSVGSWKSLVVFKGSNNLISGPIPQELTSLSQLNSLILDGNQLSGELPSEIISWKNLNSLNLARNELSGSIPSAFGSLPVLNYLDLSDNKFTGQIPPELGNLKPNSLNLSSNKLTGKIPYELENNVYKDSFLNTDLCSDNDIPTLPKCSIYRDNSKSFSSKNLALIIVLASVALSATLYFTWFTIKQICKRKHLKDQPSWKLTSFHRVDFTEEKVLGNLSDKNLIGSGGFGKVYRVPINQSGECVAVKKIWSKRMSNTIEKEFQAEVHILGTIRHINIVKLLCCISSEDSKLLVYEYMKNQSLDKWIHESRRQQASLTNGLNNRFGLDWPNRLKIAIGAAQGLSYMHHDCSPPIVHRDLKSSNILLDSDFNAKIADFGLAKILAKPGGQNHLVSAVAGSFGYMAPEYCYSTKVNEKVDIYSFGVVLLELVTGKEPQSGDEYLNLAEWAWRHYNKGNPIVDALDKQVKKQCYFDEMTNVFKIGLMCTSSLPSSRPSMKEVLHVLKRCDNAIEGSHQAQAVNERDFVPLLGNGGYISSCKNSRKTVEEDVLSMV